MMKPPTASAIWAALGALMTGAALWATGQVSSVPRLTERMDTVERVNDKQDERIHGLEIDASERRGRDVERSEWERAQRPASNYNSKGTRLKEDE
jgi:hypothetical protein